MSNRLWLFLVTAIALSSPGAQATYAQPLHGGCYLRQANVCRIEVDSFTIPVNAGAGERVAQFRLYSNRLDAPFGSELLWEFSSSSSYSFKPTGNFSPSLPESGFSAVCGATYTLSIHTRGDTAAVTGSFGVAGLSDQFTCPAALLRPGPIFSDGFEN